MLKNAMLVDKSFKLFEEMLSYASKKIPDLYDEHDETELNMNKEEWTRDYMNLLKKIVTHVYPAKK